MEASVIQDEQFMRWITSAAAERYWIYDGKGQRIQLKAGWEKAQAEYDRITGRGLEKNDKTT